MLVKGNSGIKTSLACLALLFLIIVRLRTILFIFFLDFSVKLLHLIRFSLLLCIKSLSFSINFFTYYFMFLVRFIVKFSITKFARSYIIHVEYFYFILLVLSFLHLISYSLFLALKFFSFFTMISSNIWCVFRMIWR